MAVYNCERYVHKAIASIRAQSYGNFEFIIVDDGCTDISSDIINRHAASDDRIKVIRRENRGLTKSLNEAVKVARGEYIARMDADDICHRDRFQDQIEFLGRNSDVVAVGCFVRLMDSCGKQSNKFSCTAATHEEIEYELWRGNGAVLCHPSLMIRRSAIIEIKGYNETYETAQDLDLYLRLAEIGRLANVERELLLYRRHEETVGSRKHRQQDSDVMDILNEALERRKQNRPKQFFDGRWQNQRKMSLRYAAQGRRTEAITDAIRATCFKPHSIRSWISLGIAIIGKPAAERWKNRNNFGSRTESVADPNEQY